MQPANTIEQLTIKDMDSLGSNESYLLARCYSLALDFASLVQINTVSRENVMLDYLVSRYRDTESLVHRLDKNIGETESKALLAIDAFIESVSSENASIKLEKHRLMIEAIAEVFPVTTN